jgi:hypothetical protein
LRSLDILIDIIIAPKHINPNNLPLRFAPETVKENMAQPIKSQGEVSEVNSTLIKAVDSITERVACFLGYPSFQQDLKIPLS